jgi:hypothetical protein
MNSFLFIIPDGWQKVEGATLDALDVNALISMISVNDYASISDKMREQGLITADESIVEARVFESTVLAYRKA